MRKGFALIELLIVIVTLPVAMFAISSIFATFFRDIPREVRLLQQNTILLDMIHHLESDMDRARDLPDSIDTLHRDDRTLLIELPDQTVCYQLQDGRAMRTVLRQESQGASNDVYTWKFRDAVIAWQCRQQGARAYAVELQTLFRLRAEGRLSDRRVNSHVYFVNALGRAREVR